MADFKDIVLGFNRMCNSCSVPPCEGCPMDIHSIDRSACMSRLFAKPDKYEGRILKWIEEHPEPVYPTWGDWLAEKGELCKNWKDIRVISTADNSASGVIGWFYKSIPADIAQKLGIEPKEN